MTQTGFVVTPNGDSVTLSIVSPPNGSINLEVGTDAAHELAGDLLEAVESEK